MNKRTLLFLAIGICSSMVAFGQKTTVPAKPAEKPAFAYLLATSDLDVKITVLNNQNSYTVRTTDELVKIGLDAGDNIIKITPIDGGKDGYTITKTAEKPGNSVFFIDLGAKRSQKAQEEQAKTFEADRQGKFDLSEENFKKRVIWGQAKDQSIEYTLLPMGTEDEEVEATFNIYFGNEKDLTGKKTVCQLLGKMLYESVHKDEIDQELDKLKSRIYFSSYVDDYAYLYISVNSNRQNINRALEITSDLLKHPSFNESDFIQVKKKEIEENTKELGKNYNIYDEIISKICPIYPKDHLLYRLSKKEEIDAINKVSLDEVKQFYNDFLGTTDAYVTIIGDFELNAVRDQILEKFSGWKSPKPCIPIPQPQQYECCFGKLVRDSLVYMPEAENVVVDIWLPIDLNGNDKSLNDANTFCGLIRNRLNKIINKKDGDSQFLGVWFSCGLSCHTSFPSELAKDAINRLVAEIKNIRSNPISNEEIEAFKFEYDQGYLKNKDFFIASLLRGPYNEGKRIHDFFVSIKNNQSITKEQINAFIDKYINPESKPITIQAGNIQK